MKSPLISLVFCFPLLAQQCTYAPQIAFQPGDISILTGVAWSYAFSFNSNPAVSSFAAQTLPPGLTLNPTTGLISGTVSVSGTYQISISAMNALGTGSAILTLRVYPNKPGMFVPITPCRLVDTRNPVGVFGGPALTGGATRIFPFLSSTICAGLPSQVLTYSLNVTVIPPGGSTFPGVVNPAGALGYLTLWPTGATMPIASTLNDYMGTVIANAALVPAGTSGSVSAFASHNTDLVIDLNGYFIP